MRCAFRAPPYAFVQLSRIFCGSFSTPGCSRTPAGCAPFLKKALPYRSTAMTAPSAFFIIAIGEKPTSPLNPRPGMLQCETGAQIKFEGRENLIKPLQDMDKVLEHMSDTLHILIGEGNHSEYPANTYYDRIFAEYNELILSIKQMVQKTEE